MDVISPPLNPYLADQGQARREAAEQEEVAVSREKRERDQTESIQRKVNERASK